MQKKKVIKIDNKKIENLVSKSFISNDSIFQEHANEVGIGAQAPNNSDIIGIKTPTLRDKSPSDPISSDQSLFASRHHRSSKCSDTNENWNATSSNPYPSNTPIKDRHWGITPLTPTKLALCQKALTQPPKGCSEDRHWGIREPIAEGVKPPTEKVISIQEELNNPLNNEYDNTNSIVEFCNSNELSMDFTKNNNSNNHNNTNNLSTKDYSCDTRINAEGDQFPDALSELGADSLGSSEVSLANECVGLGVRRVENACNDKNNMISLKVNNVTPISDYSDSEAIDISSNEPEIDTISLDTPFLKRTVDDEKLFNEINKLRKISKISTFIDFISGFAYLSLKYQFFWLLLTSIPSIYIFWIIPRNLIYYKSVQEKKFAIDSFKQIILQNKHLEYYKRWLIIISFIRFLISIFVWIQLETNIFINCVLIFLILFPLFTSFIVSSFEMKFLSKIKNTLTSI